MKKLLFITAILLTISCKEEPKEEIRLGDYNVQETEIRNDTTPISPAVTDTVADSTKAGADSTQAGSEAVIKKVEDK